MLQELSCTKGKKNIMAAISLFTNMSIFFNKESRFPGGQGLNHAANLYFKTYVALRLCWEVKKKGKKSENLRCHSLGWMLT